jgi:hypothetical protein
MLLVLLGNTHSRSLSVSASCPGYDRRGSPTILARVLNEQIACTVCPRLVRIEQDHMCTGGPLQISSTPLVPITGHRGRTQLESNFPVRNIAVCGPLSLTKIQPERNMTPIEPPEIPPATPGTPTEPPPGIPPGNPRPEIPPPVHEPGESPRPDELPGRMPDEVPVRGPPGPTAPPPATADSPFPQPSPVVKS